MQEIVLPSSPNWFLSSVSSGNDSGLYAFGAKNQIFVYDLSKNYYRSHQHNNDDKQETDYKRHFLPKFVACYAEHTEKISSVCLAPDSDQWICCSADEVSVKLWDIRSLVTIQMHNEHKGKIMCMTWSTCNSDLILTADEKGTVVIWKLKNNFVKPICFEKDMVCSIKASPHSGSQFAIGYRTGIALIIDISKSYPVILQRLRGHEAEITSICWCPIKGENFLNESGDVDDGALIATAGRKTIRIWSSTKGKEIFYRKLPQSSTARYDPHDPAGKRLWMDIHWPRSMPHHLVSTSSGPHGDLYLLDIRKTSEQNLEKFIARHVSKHTKLIFNITGVGDKLCTFSMDRIITVWSLSHREAICSMCSFGGYLYCIKASPLDPGRIAIGAGDNTIRIWNQSNKSNLSDISNFFYGIRSKITSVAWHPEKEGLLAYGTDDGRVGVYNTLASKPPTMSSTFHNKTVYVVCWGPPLNADSAGYQLYSVGDGVILQHFIGDPGKNAVNFVNALELVNKPQKEKLIRSDMSWKPDYTAFAIGHENGCVSVYQFPKLNEVCQVTAFRKLINCTKWHPDTTVESPGGSPCQNWLAFAGNDGPISVIDLSGILATRKSPGKPELVKITEVSCQVSGHIPRTTDMCWSPHHDGRLVSVGYDNVAIVWNMRTSEAVAVFNGHEGRLLTVLWSGIDPDVILTGGFDGTLRMWRVSQQAGTVPSIADRKKKKKKSGGSAIMASNTSSKQEKTTTTEQEIQELQVLLLMKKQVLSQIEGTGDETLQKNYHDAEGQDTPLEGDDKDTPTTSSSSLTNSGHQLGDSSTTLGIHPTSSQHPLKVTAASANSARSSSDESDEQCGTNRGGVPSASELVPPVRPLFSKPRVPVNPGSSAKPLQDGTTMSDAASISDDKARRRKQKPKSLFPVSSAANNRGKVFQQEDILDLTKLVTGQGSADLVDSKPHLGIFTDRLGTHRCLLQESEYHLNHDNMEYHLQLELWRGNIAGAVQIARQRNELSDWIVAMAPLASHDLWELVSAEYAEQLEEDGQYHKAATYLLAAHKVHQAIDLFRRHRLFREAVSLARMRLSPVDPMLEDLYTEWGQNLMKDGQFEQAAKCYLAMRHIQEAGKALTRRSDQSSLKTACHMTLLANEKQQGLSYAYKLFTQNLVMGEWREAYKFLGEHSSLKVLLPLLSTHELLIQHLSVMCPNLCLTQRPVTPEHFSQWDKNKETKGKASLPEFLVDKSDIDPVVPWEPYLIGEHTFPHHLLRIWHQHLDITMVTQELKAMHTAISQLISLRQNLGDLPSLMILVSMDVTLSLLVLLTSETSSAIIHLLQAMSTLHNSNHGSLLQALCRLMLPQGPKYLLKLQQEFNASRVLITMESHGDVDKAGGEGHNTIKKFLTDIKEDGAISTSNLRCRDLDCLRAYYYLAVLNFLRESFPSAQQEEDILDGMPNGVKEKVISLSNGQDKGTLPVGSSQISSEDRKAEKEKVISLPNGQDKVTLPVGTSPINSEDRKAEKENAQSLSGGKNFLDQNGKIYPDLKAPSFSNLFTTVGISKSNFAEPGHRSLDLTSRGVASNEIFCQGSSDLSQTSCKTSPTTPVTSVLSPTGCKKSLSDSSSVDPPFVPSSVSQQKVELTAIQTVSSTSRRSLSPSAPVRAATEDLTKTPASGANVQIKSSTPEGKDTPNSIQAQKGQGQLSYPNLLRLSKGILWDIQAKREALTETLGYIHSAISQHLLANRQAEACFTSSTVTLSPTSNSSSYIPAMDGELEADGCCHQSRYFTLPSPSLPLPSPSQPLSSPLLNTAISSKAVVKTETNTKKGPVAPTAGETSKDVSSIERTRSLSPPPVVRLDDVTPNRGPFRSKSETCSSSLSPTNPSSKLDPAVSLQVEQDLLGNFDGNPIAFQKSRKVLWLDGKGTAVDESPTSPKPVFNISRLAPDGSTIPVEWDDLPVDVKYTQPYMTLPLLKQEQDLVTQELRRVPDASKAPFPGTNISIHRLLDTCLNSPHLKKEEKLSYFKQLKDWAVLFAVTTHQQLETESFFSAAAVEYFPDSSC